MNYKCRCQTLESLTLSRISGILQGIILIHYVDCIIEWSLLAYESPVFCPHINSPFWVVYVLGARVNRKTKVNGLTIISKSDYLIKDPGKEGGNQNGEENSQVRIQSFTFVCFGRYPEKRCLLTCGCVINNFKMSTECHGDINNWERNHSRYSSVRKMSQTYHLFLKCLSSVVFMVHLIHERRV